MYRGGLGLAILQTRINNDVGSNAIQLVQRLIPQQGCGGTDFTLALKHAQALIRDRWSSDR
jgi:hypothetical protein